jgi:hypothetical protein
MEVVPMIEGSLAANPHPIPRSPESGPAFNAASSRASVISSKHVMTFCASNLRNFAQDIFGCLIHVQGHSIQWRELFERVMPKVGIVTVASSIKIEVVRAEFSHLPCLLMALFRFGYCVSRCPLIGAKETLQIP